eukprot:3092685-Rhodomonas_salina.1
MADARRVMLRLAPAVMLAAALAMSVLALFVFVPHDRATELLYKHAGAARAQQFLRSVRDAQKAEKFVHSLQEREKAAARAGGLEAQHAASEVAFFAVDAGASWERQQRRE